MTPGIVVWFHAQPYDGGITTTGHISGFDTQTKNEGSDTHHPVVTFETDSGETVEFRDNCGSSNRPRAGSSVRVSYEPSDPKRARNLDGCTIVLGWVFIAVGVVIILVAGVTFCYFLLRRPRSPRGVQDPPRYSAPVPSEAHFASRSAALVRGPVQFASRAATQVPRPALFAPTGAREPSVHLPGDLEATTQALHPARSQAGEEDDEVRCHPSSSHDISLLHCAPIRSEGQAEPLLCWSGFSAKH